MNLFSNNTLDQLCFVLNQQPAPHDGNLTLFPFRLHVLHDRVQMENAFKVVFSKGYLEVREGVIKLIDKARVFLDVQAKTFELTVRLLDKVAMAIHMDREYQERKCVAACCLMLAFKVLEYEQISISTFCYLFDNLSEDKVRGMEIRILEMLGFETILPLVYDYYEILFNRKVIV